MTASEFVFGAAMIAGGVFVGVYGEQLFRFVLAVIGFAIGFGAVYLLLDGQSDAVRLLFGVIVGGIAAGVLFMLVDFGLYIAGGIAGAVVGVMLAAILGLSGETVPAAILTLAGAGAVGFFGKRIGAVIVPLGTAAAAALMVVYGFAAWFGSELDVDLGSPGKELEKTQLIVLVLVVFSLSFLAQWNIADLRRRLLNR
ncbi:MAG: hypothetical protein KJ006_12700 [Thermoleophilia bacterium]|nr:hypothetical protein [Thermoleophilia bacterium]